MGHFTDDLELFVLEGNLKIGGHRLQKYSYSYIPAGIVAGPWECESECTILWMPFGHLTYELDEPDSRCLQVRGGGSGGSSSRGSSSSSRGSSSRADGQESRRAGEQETKRPRVQESREACHTPRCSRSSTTMPDRAAAAAAVQLRQK